MNSPDNLPLRPVLDIYDEPWVAWTLRGAGHHLHPGMEVATAYLAERATHFGFPTGGRVLEVTSALGGPARMLARYFAADVICADMHPLMQKALRQGAIAESLSLRLHPVVARTERLPFGPGTIDAAWSQDAMCHMDKPAVLAEVSRVLKPGALFVFSDWMSRSPLAQEDWEKLAELWGFPSLFTLNVYVDAVCSAGFELLFAEDRTPALMTGRAGRASDQQAFEAAFSARWGEDELQRQKAPGELWQGLVKAEKMMFGVVIARKTSA